MVCLGDSTECNGVSFSKCKRNNYKMSETVRITSDNFLSGTLLSPIRMCQIYLRV